MQLCRVHPAFCLFESLIHKKRFTGESQSFSRLSRRAPSQQQPVIISFNAPTPQPTVRTRSNMSAMQSDQGPAALDYKPPTLQIKSNTKSKSDVFINLDKRTIESASATHGERKSDENSTEKIASRPPPEQGIYWHSKSLLAHIETIHCLPY